MDERAPLKGLFYMLMNLRPQEISYCILEAQWVAINTVTWQYGF